MKTHEHRWHKTKLEGVNLENDEINKCTGYVCGFIFLKQGDLYSYYFGNFLISGGMNLQEFCGIMCHFIKVDF